MVLLVPDIRHKRPARLHKDLWNLVEFWQKWEFAGDLPAKSFRSDTKRHCSGDVNKCSRIQPIHLMLESLIVHKKCVPAEAFRLVESTFGKMTMGKLAKEIRHKVTAGTLFLQMCVLEATNEIFMQRLPNESFLVNANVFCQALLHS